MDICREDLNYFGKVGSIPVLNPPSKCAESESEWLVYMNEYSSISIISKLLVGGTGFMVHHTVIPYPRRKFLNIFPTFSYILISSYI